jgi:hypothetical protein
MKLKLLYQGSFFLVVFTFIQCEGQKQNGEIHNKVSIKVGHNILENGRIISKPVSYLPDVFIY